MAKDLRDLGELETLNRSSIVRRAGEVAEAPKSGSINSLTLVKLIQAVKKYGKIQQTESEAIANIDYDVESSDLTVEFQQRGTYVYHGVDLDTYTDFAQASSWGTYFNMYIRNIGLSYERVA